MRAHGPLCHVLHAAPSIVKNKVFFCYKLLFMYFPLLFLIFSNCMVVHFFTTHVRVVSLFEFEFEFAGN